MPREAAVGVAARRRPAREALEVRQDQIEDLPRLDFEHPLLEEEAERIGVLVARDLQNALVHRQHGDARSFAGRRRASSASRPASPGVAPSSVTGCVRAARFARERRDAVRQRAHEQFVGRRIAQELHADVAVALEVGRQRDSLHRARRAWS